MTNRTIAVLALCLALAGCGGAGKTPQGTFASIMTVVEKGQAPERLNPYLTESSVEYLERYRELTTRLEATNLPPDPATMFVEQMRRLQPTVLGVEDFEERTRAMGLRYADGRGGVFLFAEEKGRWKLDLAEELRQSVEILEGIDARTQAVRFSAETGAPLPPGLFGDDD
jgi:hypothetical protein